MTKRRKESKNKKYQAQKKKKPVKNVNANVYYNTTLRFMKIAGRFQTNDRRICIRVGVKGSRKEKGG